jgi:hypothetical protein
VGSSSHTPPPVESAAVVASPVLPSVALPVALPSVALPSVAEPPPVESASVVEAPVIEADPALVLEADVEVDVPAVPVSPLSEPVPDESPLPESPQATQRKRVVVNDFNDVMRMVVSVRFGPQHSVHSHELPHSKVGVGWPAHVAVHGPSPHCTVAPLHASASQSIVQVASPHWIC